MVEGRFWASCSVLKDFLLVCSGNNGQQVLLSTERFDPIACVWEALAPMRRLRSGACALTVAGRLYLCGGHDRHVVHDSVEVFDPEHGVWREARPMLQRRSGAAGAVLGHGLVLLGGNDGGQVLGTAEAYDPEEDVWPLGASIGVLMVDWVI